MKRPKYSEEEVRALYGLALTMIPLDRQKQFKERWRMMINQFHKPNPHHLHPQRHSHPEIYHG